MKNSLHSFINGTYIPSGLILFKCEPNKGKSLIMTSLAAKFYEKNYEVSYISFEQPVERIMRRIHTNLFDLDFYELKVMPETELKSKIDKLKENHKNLLTVDYLSNNSFNFKNFCDYLEERKNLARIIFLDYLELTKISIQELSELAEQKNITIISALQTQKQEIETKQFINKIQIIEIEQSDAMKLKYEYNLKSLNDKVEHIINIDYSKMKIFNDPIKN